MNNKQFGLFLIGIIAGGSLMLSALGSPLLRSRLPLNRAGSATGTSAIYPQLIALEAAGNPSLPTPASPTFTAEPAVMWSTIAATPTATWLSLIRPQQSTVIGYSAEGRPLTLYTFGSGEHERMIVADIHGGDEWNTLTLANQLLEYLDQIPQTVPEGVTLYILPTLNPDGEARAHNKYGRLNHNGVDLNRNFPVNWLADWNRSGCWNYLPSSGGPAPGSEMETQALMSFIDTHQIEALISYHSAALGIFPGGDPRDADSIGLAESIAQVSTYPYPPLDTGCAYSGTLPDYAVSKGSSAVDIELTDHFDTDLEMNLAILQVLLTWESGP